jgi:tetrahydromethanopterin S-methyltransferase subunit E
MIAGGSNTSHTVTQLRNSRPLVLLAVGYGVTVFVVPVPPHDVHLLACGTRQHPTGGCLTLPFLVPFRFLSLV